MSGSTMRGTPSRGGNRGPNPYNGNSPANGGGGGGPNSSIPRPTLETQHPAPPVPNEAASTVSMSASRQKQSKRDEVCPLCPFLFSLFLSLSSDLPAIH